MGKGKGGFEFWATRVGPARVIFEIGTPTSMPPIREELARDGKFIFLQIYVALYDVF